MLHVDIWEEDMQTLRSLWQAVGHTDITHDKFHSKFNSNTDCKH